MSDALHGDAAGVPKTEGPDAEGFTRVWFEDGAWNDVYRGVRGRRESHDLSRVRIDDTGRDRSNSAGSLHGGFMLAFLDHAIFIGPITAGRLPFNGSVTLNLATQFVRPGIVGAPLDCTVEIVSETGRLMFVRGQLEQGEHVVLTYQATLRKMTAPKA